MINVPTINLEAASMRKSEATPAHDEAVKEMVNMTSLMAQMTAASVEHDREDGTEMRRFQAMAAALASTGLQQ